MLKAATCHLRLTFIVYVRWPACETDRIWLTKLSVTSCKHWILPVTSSPCHSNCVRCVIWRYCGLMLGSELKLANGSRRYAPNSQKEKGCRTFKEPMICSLIYSDGRIGRMSHMGHYLPWRSEANHDRFGPENGRWIG